MGLYVSLIVGILLTSSIVCAQSSFSDLEFVSIKDGLPKRGITSITMDEQGFIWISMLGGGLYRYDGLNYTAFNYDFQDTTSINSNVVHTVFEDSEGQLWMGSDGGLNIYNKAQNNFWNIPFLDQVNTERDQINILTMVEDINGNIYAGSNYNGLYRIDTTKRVAKRIVYKGKNQSKTPLHILDLAISSSGVIYAATNLGLKVLDVEKNRLTDAFIYTNSGQQTIDVPIQCLMVDALNNLWIGSQGDGIYKTSCLNSTKINLKYLDHFPITERRVMSLAQNSNGHVFCGMENDGLFILNQYGKTVKKLHYEANKEMGLQSNSVWQVYFDPNDRLWVGYYDKGVAIFDPNYRKFNVLNNIAPYTKILNQASVTDLTSDAKGNIWVATDGSGVHYLDQENDNITSYLNNIYANKTGAAIQTIFMDSQENVWTGGWNEGIFLFKKGQQNPINFTQENTNGQLRTNRITALAEDANGTIWIGTWSKGLHSYNPNNQQFTYHDDPKIEAYGLHEFDIRKLLIDEQNQLWVGTSKGLFKLDLDTRGQVLALTSYKEIWSEQLHLNSGFNNILSIYKSSAEVIWVGTDGAGLLKYDLAQEKLVQYHQKNGFAQQTASAIIEATAGHIWVSGRSGISHLNTQNGQIDNYSKVDGLISNDFNYNAVMKDQVGKLYFGNVMGGFNYFDPDSIPINQSEVKVYLTNFKLFNQTITPGEDDSPLDKTIATTDAITLNHLQSVFTIEYTGINYTRPEKNQFAYYLEGLEDDWNYVGNQRSATYTSLKSGDYVFKVKAANNDGLWNETSVKLKIKVLPPWWKSNAGFVVYILLFLLSLYIFYRVMRIRVLAKEEIQSERQRREQAQLLNNKKIQFFTNISHEFRTPLTLIVNPLEDILQAEQYDLPDEVQAKNLIIYKNAKRLERLINELMDFRKLSFNKLKVKAQKTEIVRFVRSVAEYFRGEAIDKNIDFKVHSNIESKYVWIDAGLIEKVLFNLLSNAFKVTQTAGKINIQLSMTAQIFPELQDNALQSAVSIAVSDTGPGLSEEHIQHIFERFYQVDNLNKSYYGGTGIGLEVVSNFVKLHKGKIEVESKLDEGTIFIVHLPIEAVVFPEQKAVTTLPATDTPLKKGKKTKKEQKKKSLLIVEDNIELQHYLKTELQKIYSVKVASDGAEGLRMAIDTLPDLILTDVIMPKIDGFELCKSIKKDVRTCHIPLLMLTAKNNADDQILGIDMGADAYITKPFNMQLLKAKLRQLLTSRQIIFEKYFSAISDAKLNKNTTSLDKDFIQQLLSIIQNRIGDTSLNVETLAAEIFLSRSQLYRKTKALTGMTVNELIRKIRLEEAKKLLEKGNVNISEVCYAVGFSSPSYFSKCFKEMFGFLPTEMMR